jgi:ATP-dependent Clp protease protease subunit
MNDQDKLQGHAWFTLSGDINSDMVHRVFDAVADMTEDMVTDAHILIQSNGGYVSDGICLYNYLSKLPIRFHFYNAGAVASIAVIVFLAGQ